MSNEPKDLSPALALALGFVPSATLLTIFGYASLNQKVTNTMFLMAALLSVVCCFTSSFLLFRRKTGLAIVAGILLLLVNFGITFFLGCMALLNGMRS